LRVHPLAISALLHPLKTIVGEKRPVSVNLFLHSGCNTRMMQMTQTVQSATLTSQIWNLESPSQRFEHRVE